MKSWLTFCLNVFNAMPISAGSILPFLFVVCVNVSAVRVLNLQAILAP